MLLSMCEVIRDHHGVEDTEQAWILGELIRYQRHPNSGATAFEDMGSEWVAVRDGARDASLRKNDPAVREIAYRWDQLLRYAALRLEADIGQTVTQQVPAAQRDPSKRLLHLVVEMAKNGHLDGALRIPNTVGDLELLVDLRARRINAAVSVAAPEDRGGRARCTWLAGQLGQSVDSNLMMEAYAKNARTPVCASLAKVREDKDVLLGEDKKDPARFRLTLTREMGVARKAGRISPGFIDSVLGLITDFYGTVVQDLTPWTPKAPKITRSAPRPEPDAVDEPKRARPQADVGNEDTSEVVDTPPVPEPLDDSGAGEDPTPPVLQQPADATDLHSPGAHAMKDNWS